MNILFLHYNIKKGVQKMNQAIEQGNIAIAQINLAVGDLKTNASKIIEYIKIAESKNIEIIVFPKHCLLGAELSNFIDRYPFILEDSQKWLQEIAAKTTKTTAIVSIIDTDKRHAFIIIKNGTIHQLIKDSDYISSKNINDGVEFLIKPINEPSKYGSEFLRQINLKENAIEKNRTIIEVNRVGANDSYSYSGMSCACDENGDFFALAKDFQEDFLIIDTYKKQGKINNIKLSERQKEFSLDYEADLERTYKSIVQGIKDYFSKCGLKRAVLGLSGGLDSTVCAVLLADALGNNNVFGVSMPSKLTSQESMTDASELARNLDIGFAEESIKPMFDTTQNCLNQLFKNVNQNWDCRYKNSFTPDNIQARSRAMFLWGISNEFEACIPIATSDKSELYMGYATINGDMSGGFAPIADVTKTKLFALARWLNKNRPTKNAIPESIILKRPGAELAIDPKTGKTLCAEDALMPYEFLDEIIWRIENLQQNYTDILNSTFIYEKKETISKEQKIEWLDKFYKRMSSALYKGYIMPPFVIVDSHSINKCEYSQPITSARINYKGYGN